MRPTPIESLRGIQAALAEAVTPEMQTEFGLGVVQTLQMLLESLASDWDTAAADLHKENQTMAALLSKCSDDIQALPGNNQLSTFVPEIKQMLDADQDQSLAISSLTLRNNDLWSLGERLLVKLEMVIDDPAYAEMQTVRKDVYGALRKRATSGWSFWDAASFRERMAKERST
jgi:hypothetical protein